MVMLRTEELVYPDLPMEDVDRFLNPEYEIEIFDQEPRKVEEPRRNLPLSYEDEFIPNEDPELKKLDARRMTAVGMISRVIMGATAEVEPTVEAYPARIIITKPGFFGRLIARVKDEEPTARVDAAIMFGKKEPRQTND